MVYNQNYQFEVNLLLEELFKISFLSRISAQKVLKVLLNLTIFSYCHNESVVARRFGKSFPPPILRSVVNLIL
jgi:uncharacterized protein YjaZ